MLRCRRCPTKSVSDVRFGRAEAMAEDMRSSFLDLWRQVGEALEWESDTD